MDVDDPRTNALFQEFLGMIEEVMTWNDEQPEPRECCGLDSHQIASLMLSTYKKGRSEGLTDVLFGKDLPSD